MHIKFPVVKYPVTRKVRCKCGKESKRSTTLEGTINPFNRNKDGEVKTYREVREDLAKQAEKWVPPKYVCRNCKGGAQ